MATKTAPTKKTISKAAAKVTSQRNARLLAPPTELPLKPGAKALDGVVDNVRRQIKIDDDTYELMWEIGGGNASLGIREAGRRLIEHKDIEPFDAERHAARAKA